MPEKLFKFPILSEFTNVTGKNGVYWPYMSLSQVKVQSQNVSKLSHFHSFQAILSVAATWDALKKQTFPSFIKPTEVKSSHGL